MERRNVASTGPAIQGATSNGPFVRTPAVALPPAERPLLMRPAAAVV